MRSPTSSALFGVVLLLGAPAFPATTSAAGKETVPGDRRKALPLVRQGVQLLQQGDYIQALAKFRAAYKLYPSPKLHFNFGQTYRQLGRPLKALTAYERFVRDAPGDGRSELKSMAQKQIAQLQRQIAVIRIVVATPGAQVTLNGRRLKAAVRSRPVRLLPGNHVVVVKKAGFESTVREIELNAGEQRTVRIELKKPRPKVVRVVYKTLRLPKKGTALAWTGVGLTVGVAVLGAVMGGLTLREQSIFDDDTRPIAERRAAGRRGERYQIATDVLLISAGVLAVGTLIWYLARVRPSGGTKRVRVVGGGIAISY